MNTMKLILKGRNFPSHLQGKEVEVELTGIRLHGVDLSAPEDWRIDYSGYEVELAAPPKEAGTSLLNVLGATPKRIEVNF